jgi:Na+-driven multidrug efflux pump
MKLGVSGASYAICMTYTSNFLALVLYTTVIDSSERFIWKINRKAFKDWMSYLKLGIPGALVMMLDIWCYEVINLQSGFLDIDATAAQIILNNIQVVCN